MTNDNLSHIDDMLNKAITEQNDLAYQRDLSEDTEILLETCDHKTCRGYQVETETDNDGIPCGQIQIECPCECHGECTCRPEAQYGISGEACDYCKSQTNDDAPY